LGSDSNDEGDEEPEGPLFDQDYLTWLTQVRLDPLNLYGLEHFVEDAKGEVDEEEAQKGEGDDDDEEYV